MSDDDGRLKMARRKINKSEAIRRYLAKHPNAAADEIVKAVNVQSAHVYNVKSMLKKSRMNSPQMSQAKQRAAASHNAGVGNGSVDEVVAAARLIHSCGGIERARLALNAAKKVAEALAN